MQTQIITECNKTIIQEIQKFGTMVLDRYSERELSDYLKDPKNIFMFLHNGKENAGFIFAVPHDLAVVRLRDEDPLLHLDSNCYYVDQIALLPQERKGMVFVELVYGFFRELAQRNQTKASSHILANNGLNKVMGRYFRKYITASRYTRLPSYADCEFEYMEITLSKQLHQESLTLH